jgi:prophage DNA circulation protein
VNKPDATEAIPLLQRLAQRLARCIAPAGVNGAQARTALGDLIAYAGAYLADDALGVPLINCFDLVRQAGATQAQMLDVLAQTAAETPVTLGAVLVRDCSIYLCLSTQAQITTTMTFVSRQDVSALRTAVRAPFDAAEEQAADAMDQASYAALIALDAAVTNFLVTTARPLPQMIGYQFAVPLPSLVIAHRLYQDASRADQIRAENKVVHPAFCPPIGVALSA